MGIFMELRSMVVQPELARSFKMTLQGSVTILHSFGTVTNDGDSPVAGVIEGTDGNFYGTAVNGGSSTSGSMV